MNCDGQEVNWKGEGEFQIAKSGVKAGLHFAIIAVALAFPSCPITDPRQATK